MVHVFSGFPILCHTIPAYLSVLLMNPPSCGHPSRVSHPVTCATHKHHQRYLLICGIFRCGCPIICPYFYTIAQTLDVDYSLTPLACMVIPQAVLFFLSNKAWCKPTSAHFFSKSRVYEWLIFYSSYTWGYVLGICSCKEDGMLPNKGKLEISIRFVFILYTLGNHTHQYFTQAFSWYSHLLSCL